MRVGGDVALVHEGPDAVDAAVVRAVDDAVRDLVVVQVPVLQRLVRGEEREEIVPALVRRQLAVLVLQDALQESLVVALHCPHVPPNALLTSRC
ncbi:hypothetical protein [Streptomyces albidoflavus]|uniref:hypothetical protein n=1 Tax=Streptomyces albidoflavus TaxID=1886 RepID=UPI001F5D42A0|nr:hypothetical protein [Streptomyces albidoflavus]